MPSKLILVVEGQDDEHVIKNLCGARDLPYVDEFVPCEGVERLLKSLPVRLKTYVDEEVVGVVIDSDGEPLARWEAISARLTSLGYRDVPGPGSMQGVVIAPPPGSRLPTVGIWMMPNNQAPGKLEDFLVTLIPDSDDLYRYARQCVAAIVPADRRFPPSDEVKAVVHTWLAWQEVPGRPLGLAIRARFFDPDSNHADGFIAWLRSLFAARDAV